MGTPTTVDGGGRGRPGRGELAVDALLVVATGPLLLMEALLRELNTADGMFTVRIAVALPLLLALPVLARFSSLVAVPVAAAATLLLSWFALPLLALSYRVGRHRPVNRAVVVVFAGIAAGGAAVVAVDGPAHNGVWFTTVAGFLLAVVLPWLVGTHRRQQLELLSAGWERAEQLEREQRITAEQARLRERARIARDMHDSLGHELSLIALRAGALQVAPDLSERHRTAAGELRESAAVATDRLRQIIGVLRDDSEQVPTEPADDSVTALVERARDSGLEVALTSTGTPEVLAPMADRAVYRVVQEALTNAARHAPGSAVEVRVDHRPGEVVVEVGDDGARGGPSLGASGGRHGLIGLGERVRLAGGTFRAGPRDEGGWAVEARIPVSGVAARAAAEPAESVADQRVRAADRYRRARWRVGWGMVVVLGLPALCVAGLMLVGMVSGLQRSLHSELPPERFALLSVGQDQASAEAVLPEVQEESLAREEQPPVPPGAECRYYRSGSSLDAGAGHRVHRLCFADGVVVAKDAYDPY
ncbi:Signal transduction histidine kinase [Marinactinospora thermotolerans DSM 45154]|uniref:histidine kinase n=1 Tax=Marinactinospora thermotolerans DSM 45154 TaxID=1122192 RepID=A0A1T4M1L4_9ACTN|nr:histidine kinase [Marinactinospora thermotolerans]SJZ60668.1 Signal transduction histidine kinase [Marinactinospora thermotolerans DSM 45154]